MTFCFATSGCVTLGPKVQREAVILKSGTPVQILENRRIKGRPLGDSDGAQWIEVDVGGWYAMPPEHWEAIKRKLEAPRE